MAKSFQKKNVVLEKVVLVGVLVIGVGLAFRIWLNRPARPHGFRAASSSAAFPDGSLGERVRRSGKSAGTPFSPGRRPGQRLPQPAPIYISNLTTEAGTYTVGVRQVADFNAPITLHTNQNISDERPRDLHLMLSLQVMSTDTRAVALIRDFAPELIITDDTGKKITVRSENIQIVPFPHGVAKLIPLPAEVGKARFLQSVEGSILVAKSPQHKEMLRNSPPEGFGFGYPGDVSFLPTPAEPSDKRVPFRLTNIPLPVENHVLGVAAGVFLSELPGSLQETALPETKGAESSVSRGAQEVRLLEGEKARPLQRLFPPFTDEPNPLRQPNRLLLLSGRPNRFSIYLPHGANWKVATASALQCTLTPVLGSDGEIDATLEVTPSVASMQPIRTSLRIWDQEPLIVLLPARILLPEASKQSRIALRLHLYLDQISAPEPVKSPFPAEKNIRGGEISCQAQVRSQPVRNGVAQVAITRVGEPAYSTSEASTSVLTLPLDENGRGIIPNMAPGIYRFSLQEITPYRSQKYPFTSAPELLRRRYAFRESDVENALQETVIVRSGSRVPLKPWNVVEKSSNE